MMELTHLLLSLGSLILVLTAYAAGRSYGRLSCRGEMTRQDGDVLRCRLAMAEALPSLQLLHHQLDGLAMDSAAEPLGQAIYTLERVTWAEGPRYRHLRRGTTYEVLTDHAHLNASDPRLLADGELMMIYVDVDSGRVCLRHPDEFLDGRFERLDSGIEPWRMPPGLRG